MRVGITYDLRQEYRLAGYSEEETAEFDGPETIEAIERVLHHLGCTTERIGHVRQLTARLAHGADWDLVFNVAEGLHGFGREAQVPALLEAFAIPYTFSDPLALTLALHTGMTKHILHDLGIPTADFTVVQTPSEVEDVDLPFPLFAKPVAEGTSKGISAASTIHTPQQLRQVCGQILHTYQQPVLVERFLPGRELTVGIVGSGRQARGLGVMEIILLDTAEPGVYSYTNKALYASRVRYRLVHGWLAAQALPESGHSGLEDFHR